MEIPDGVAASGAVEAVEALSSLSGRRVLDVGCGDGDFIDTLGNYLKDVGSYVGVDIDPDDLERASSRLEGSPVELLEMDASSLAFDDASFDIVCIANSMHHMEKLDAVLSEMHRVLREGGSMIVLEMFSDGGQTEAQRTDIEKHHLEAGIDRLEGTYHRETLTREEIRGALDGLGLVEVGAFETSCPIRCITCESRFQCEDPMDPEFITATLKELDEDMDRIDRLPDHEGQVLCERVETLKERVKRTGISPASSLLLVARK